MRNFVTQDGDARLLSRRTDPETSHAAAERSAHFASSHAGRILAVLRSEGPGTPEHIGRFTGLTTVQIDRRLHEMQAKGLIRTTGAVHNGFRAWEAV